MKKHFSALFAIALTSAAIPESAAIQYNIQAENGQAYFSVDTKQTVYVDVKKNGSNVAIKDSVITDIGWYKYEDVVQFYENLPKPGEGPSRPWDTFGPGPERHAGDIKTGMLGEFSPDDKIVLWVETTSSGGEKSTYSMYITNTKEKDVWLLGESGESLIFNWGQFGFDYGKQAQHSLNPEGYEFSITTRQPSGQPLPGIIATLIVGGGTVLYLKKRKKLYAVK